MNNPDPPDAAFDPQAVDLALFGCWDAAPAHREPLPAGDPLADDVRAVVLETKSADEPQLSAAEDAWCDELAKWKHAEEPSTCCSSGFGWDAIRASW